MYRLTYRKDRTIRFLCPEGFRKEFFMVPEDWDLERIEHRRSCSEEFCTWLRKEILKRGYTVSGVSRACDMSHGWLQMILEGKRPLREKYVGILERELGMKEGTIRKKLTKSLL